MNKNTRKIGNEQNIDDKEKKEEHKPTRSFERKYYEFNPELRVCVLTKRKYGRKKHFS
ncbi:MAG TPA: hypothetical protein PKY25_00260 [Bacilli bacterium]|nr:hypothetical protein [Bacilli bacterium]